MSPVRVRITEENTPLNLSRDFISHIIKPVSYRIIYKKIFDSEKDAIKATKELNGKASNPTVHPGKEAGWLVVLYEADRLSTVEKGMGHYRTAGLTVFMQKVA